MKLFAFFLFFSLSVSSYAEKGKNTRHLDVENGTVDLSADTRKPTTGDDRVVEKMAHIPELVAQERFLQQLGFSGDWPTPEQVDEKIAKMKSEQDQTATSSVKMRGPANYAQLENSARQYRTVYNQWSDIPDFDDQQNGYTKVEPRHLASADSQCMHCGTRFSAKPVAAPVDEPARQRSSVDEQ